MPKRLSFEEVKKAFDDKGYELLDKTYVNSYTPLRYKCPQHPKENNQIRLNDLKKGDGCSYCSGKKIKWDYEKVKELFKERGYELLENVYRTTKTKMRFKCPKHPNEENSVRFGDFLKGVGCPYCSGLKRLNFKEVKRRFEEKGYILLEKEYVNNYRKMKYLCPKHPNEELSISVNNLKKHGCPYCNLERFNGETHPCWKGGLTDLTRLLRKNLKEWKRESLENYNYRCVITKEHHSDLHIHHAVSFHEVRDKTLKELGLYKKINRKDYSELEVKMIISKLEEKHGEILGIPLRKDLHKLFHLLYGKKNNTLEQFYEFKARWESGEFSKELEKKEQKQLTLLV